MSDVYCGAEPCPVILNSTCVFYRGQDLLYIGVNANDNLQIVIEKINQAFQNTGIGYAFNNGVIQPAPNQPVQLGGSLIQNTTIGGSYTLTFVGNVQAAKHITTGGTASQFVKGDGSLDNVQYQPIGNYLTGLSGDGTASGPGVGTFTLATVNFAPGVFGNGSTIPVVTVNAKGLVTNITPTPIVIPPQPMNFIGDVVGSGLTGTAVTLSLQNVNSNVYNTNTALKFAVNAKGLVTSATPLTQTDINSALGYTPVPDTRTLTINGVTYNLSANRSWTVGAIINFSITGNSGPATWNPGTASLNIPEYTLSGLGGVPLTRTLTINGTAYDLSLNRTWTVGDIRSDQTYNDPSWLTGLAWSKILSTPTTLSGYGITDAYTQTQVNTLLTGYQPLLTNPITGTGTTNELAYFTGTTTLGSLSTTTYPSLTELSYVKGVTSSIQTQLNAKQNTLSLTTTGSSGASTLVGSTLNVPNYTLSGLGGIGGSIASGQVAFGSGANTISGSNNLFWDSANNRLGIGTNSPATALNIIQARATISFQDTTVADSSSVFFGAFNDILQLAVNRNPSTGVYSNVNKASSQISLTGANGSGLIQFFNTNTNNSTPSEKLRILGNGNVIIQNGGTFTDSGFRLDVNGTARVQGALSVTGSTTASSAIARGANYTPTLVAAANNDVLVGLDINPTFTNGAFTGVSNIAIRTNHTALLNLVASFNSTNDANIGTYIDFSRQRSYIGYSATNNALELDGGGSKKVIIRPNSSAFETGGTTYDFSSTGLAINSANNDSWISIDSTTVNAPLILFSRKSQNASLRLLNYNGTRGGFLFQGSSNYSGAIWNDIVDFQANGNTYFYGNLRINQSTDAGFRLDVNGTARVQGDFTISDTRNIILATTTGTKIGTATSQKLSLWNATPDVQPTTAITASSFVANTSGIVDDTATFGGYTIGKIVAALKRLGALA